MKKQKIIFYIADVWKNEMMRCVDLRPDYKWYVDTVGAEITNVPDNMVENLKGAMKASRDSKDFYVPAIRLGDNLIVDDGVKELSDGKVGVLYSYKQAP